MKYKTFRLFVSSTFNDFKDEREILHDEVLPRIRSFCNERGYDFQMIDLRWGIYSESTLNHRTLPICINEVKRCKDFSPRPNFLAMVGERYGWVPLPPFISQEEFSHIAEQLNECEQKALAEWYLYDSNEVGGQYYLQTRSGSYVDDSLWSDKESELRELLIKGAEKAELEELDLEKYTASATEHEIISGMFADETTADSSIAFFRTGFSSKDVDGSRINSLKQRIRNFMQATDTTENLIELGYDDEYKSSFSRRITDLLLELVAREMDRIEELESDHTHEHRLLRYYSSDRFCLCHEQAFEDIGKYVSGGTCGTLFLTGDSGCGKTTLLAKFISEYSGESTFVFYGENSSSCSISDALEYIVGDLYGKYRRYDPRPEEPQNSAEAFHKAIGLVPRFAKTHLIVIDGIDMFWDLPFLKENFLPSKLPKNVKIIISSADRNLALKFKGANDVCLSMENLSPTQSLDCFEHHIGTKHRCIQNNEQKQTVNSVLDSGCTPLQAKMLAALASKWKSDETHTELPTTAEDAALAYIRNAYETFGHDRDTVLYCLALISVSPLGLTEQDILSMLLQFDSVKQHFVRETKHGYDLSDMPYAIWSRLFFDLEDCLEISFYDGEIIIRFSHNVFLNVTKKYFPEYCEQAIPVLLQHFSKFSTAKASSARMELTLLAQCGYADKLAELLTDTKYVSACVKHGYVRYLIEQLSAILPTLYGTTRYDKARRMLKCLIQNRKVLSHYRTEFDRCAYEHKLTETPAPHLELQMTSESIYNDAKINSVFYSADACFSWSPDAKSYAVYERSYIYICDALTHLEKARIYLEAENDVNLQACEVMWLSLNIIAVLTYQNKLLLYMLSDGFPIKLYASDYDASKPAVNYSEEDNSLIYCEKSNVVCVNVFNREVKYRIPITPQSCVCISNDKNNVIVRTRASSSHRMSYLIYDSKTGKEIRTALARNREIKSCTAKIFSVAGNKLLQIYTEPGYHGFLLQNCDDESYVFLHPPKYKEIKQTVVGYGFLICVYEKTLFAINLFDLSTKRLDIENITNVAWIVRDERISVWTRAYDLMEFSLSDFDNVGKAFARQLNLFGGTMANEISPIFSAFEELRNLLPRGNAKEYCSFFTTWYDEYEHTEITSDITVPTLLTVAENGIKAVAYEYRNSVAVLSASNEPLFWIERLFLGVDNNILGFAFSRDSRYLLLWTNLFVRVISVGSKRIIANISMKRRPAKSVSFGEEGTLEITFADGKKHEAALSDRGVKFAERLPKKVRTQQYSFAYYINPLENSETVYNIFDERKVDRSVHSSEWVDHTRRYCGKKQWLLYQNGRFYLDGNLDRGFKNCHHYDFAGAANDCVLACSSSLEAYVFEKNDLTYSLFEYDAQKKLLLVCKKTNSVIIFDVDKMEIISAYKPAKRIIGASMNQALDHLTLFLDSASNTVFLKVNL